MRFPESRDRVPEHASSGRAQNDKPIVVLASAGTGDLNGTLPDVGGVKPAVGNLEP